MNDSRICEKLSQILILLANINDKLREIQVELEKQKNQPFPLYQTENGTVIKCFVTPEDYD